MADPFVNQLSAILSAQDIADKARLDQSIQSALVNFGQIPENLPSTYGVSDLTKELAKKNTAEGLSIMARLGKEHDIASARIPDLMAARGILSSGETGYQLQNEADRFKQVSYDANRQLLDYLQGAQQAYIDAQRQREFTLLDANQQAAIREQERAFNQQQLAIQQQQMTADSGGGGFDMDSFMASLFGDGGQPAGPVGPSQQEFAIMAAAVPKAARHRSEQEKALFAQYADWRASNPNWWK